MYLRLLSAILLTVAAASAQAPAGRWDGTITFGALKVPFRIDFEGSMTSLKASLANGDARAPSTFATFSDGKLSLSFDRSGAKLEGTLADGELKGSITGAPYGTVPFTASAFCSCGFEGEAGPDIGGTWEAPSVGWRMEIRRKGEDTFVTLTRPGSDEIGPLSGRFDGLLFSLRYFDGTRAAVLELEPNKSGGLDLVWTEPGMDAKKFKAVPAKPKP